MPKAITVGKLRKTYSYKAHECGVGLDYIQPARLVRCDEDGIHHTEIRFAVLKVVFTENVESGGSAKRQSVFCYTDTRDRANAIADGLQATIGTDADEEDDEKNESDYADEFEFNVPGPEPTAPLPTFTEMLQGYAGHLGYNANALIPGAEPSVLDARD